MSETGIDLKEFHWLMDMLQTIDIGLVVVDRNFQVKVWKSALKFFFTELPKKKSPNS